MAPVELIEETPYRWRIPASGQMRVPAVVFASRTVLPDLAEDRSLEQAAAVATLPGIVGASYVMPDLHWGYGFPIGGVAATDVEAGGVVSPGGVGFDISCGVRLLASNITTEQLSIDRVLDELDAAIPRGMGKGAVWQLRNDEELTELLLNGSRYAVQRGHGVQRDLDRCEDGGALSGADPRQVSERARDRGIDQVGSLGSGNHFLEIQQVEQLVDPATAEGFGLRQGQVCVLIHCGSRGLGHQVCTDHVKTMMGAMAGYGIEVPDRQLACVPVRSPAGEAYLAGMTAAANFGRANRQLLTEAARRSFAKVMPGTELDLVYDISHNMAKLEHHDVDGVSKLLCVHRKGATRALPPGDPELPDDLKPFGQPVFVPGSMGTASWVLTGVEGSDAFHSTCHGSGRTMSRSQAKKRIRGDELAAAMKARGIAVRARSIRELPEEAPEAYKDVDAVVETCERAGLCRRVARLRPLGVVKG